MKMLHILAVLLLLGAAYAEPVPAESDPPLNETVASISNTVIDLFKARCETLAGKDAIDDIKAAIQEATECMEERIGEKLVTLPLYCAAYREKCMKPAFKRASACFKPEEEYIETYAKEGFAGYVSWICDDDMQTIRDLLDESNNRCVDAIVDDKEFDACGVSALRPFKDTLIEDSVLSKALACRATTEYESCISALLNRHCSDNTTLKSLLERAFEAYHRLCDDA